MLNAHIRPPPTLKDSFLQEDSVYDMCMLCHHFSARTIIGHLRVITLWTLGPNGTELFFFPLITTCQVSLSTVFRESCFPRAVYTFPLVTPTKLCDCAHI